MVIKSFELKKKKFTWNQNRTKNRAFDLKSCTQFNPMKKKYQKYQK